MLTFITNIVDDSLLIKTQRSIVISATNKHIDQCERNDHFEIKLLLT
jgi:hypothetical protein